MEEAFVIMQFGNAAIDSIWKEVYYPVIKKCGLDPKRVDKHNEGRLLQSEIANFVKRAKIVIADLTNERPNCYLEVGYTMGVDKFNNLILCAREDHNTQSINHIKNGPKVHFDLSGYGFLWWDEKKLGIFKKELENKIRHRLSILKRTSNKIDPDINYWPNRLADERKIVSEEFKKNKIDNGLFELVSTVSSNSIRLGLNDLKMASEEIDNPDSKWPFGIIRTNENSFKPTILHDGIRSIMMAEPHFSYWTLFKNGSFYLAMNYDLECCEKERVFHFDIGIWRIAESFLCISRLYKKLGLSKDDKVRIEISHYGMKDRTLTAYNKVSFKSIEEKNCQIDKIMYPVIEDSLENILNSVDSNTYDVAADLFSYFDFSGLSKNISRYIIKNLNSVTDFRRYGSLLEKPSIDVFRLREGSKFIK
jgi:hypothetical protein